LDDPWREEMRAALSSDREGPPLPEQDDDAFHQRVLTLLGPTDDPRMLGRIGPYEITGILGQGGMGVVFKGCDAALNRFVAIKMLLPHLATSGAARKRFAREAQAAAAVVNDYVMAIHSVAEWQGMPYLVMSYARGMSLQKRIDDQGPLGVAEILRIGMQAATGLAAAHSQGLVHRDVKPANILLADGVERVRLTDFGLARAVDDISLTSVGTLAGTPPFMSPEQARGQAVDTRSDLFSLGSVLYATCTGRAPFRADSSYAVLRLVNDNEPTPIQQINPDIPDWLCAVVAKLMSKRPDDRYSSAIEVADLFQGCLAHLQNPTGVSLPSSLPRSPRRRITSRTAISATVVFGVLVILGLLFLQYTQPLSGERSGLMPIAAADDAKQPAPPPAAKIDAPPAAPKDAPPVAKLDEPPLVGPVEPKLPTVTPEQLRAIDALRRHNVKFKFDGPGRPVVQVDFAPGAAVDDILKEIQPLTDIGVLGLQGTMVSDEALKYVASLKKLHQLYLGQTSISDAGLKELVGLERLTHLGLENTNVTDAGMKSVIRLKNLTYLNVGGTNVSNGCLKDISTLTKMGMLCLYGTGVTDAGMKDVAGMTNLKTLLIYDTSVSDVGVKELAPLKQLKKINAQNSRVTETGLRALQQSVPMVKVEKTVEGETIVEPKQARGWRSAAVVASVVLAACLALAVRVFRRHRMSDAAPVIAIQPPANDKSTSTQSPIRLNCANCKRGLQAEKRLAGKVVKCPGCGTAVEVPNHPTNTVPAVTTPSDN
jgi:serine/threonine protein kinase